MADRSCAWCRSRIRATARRDARFCSQSCRQASHRFTRGAVARARCDASMRFAYADPPYPGMAHLYRGHPDYAGEVDHSRLAEQLVTDFPDGWALSTSARALPFVLSCFAGVDVSVAAWFRRRRPNVTARRPVSAWEPVVFAGGRDASPVATSDASAAAPGDGSRQPGRDASLVDRGHASLVDDGHVCRWDAVICLGSTRTTDPNRVIGAKPAEFAYWMFDLLGALPGDELVDLFPGSGGIGRAWAHYTSLDTTVNA